MKKKIAALLVGACITGLLAGCGEKQLSNDYITITQYKNLEVPQAGEPTEITDDMVESTITNTRNSSLTDEMMEEQKDQKIADGDTVILDYTGSIDGEEFSGGSASGTSLTLGSGGFIGAEGDYKGFEEQIVGHKVGEDFKIKVKFPDDYNGTEVAGKVADFAITVHGVVPELTDDWVKENSEKSKTVEEYKAEVKADLEKEAETTVKESLKMEALNALTDKTEVKSYPEGEVEEQTQVAKDYYTGMAEAYGLTFEEFLTQSGVTQEEFDAQMKEGAEMAVAQRLAIELVAEEEKLVPSDEEYEEEFAKLAEEYNYEDVDALKEAAKEEDLKMMVLQDRVAEFLVKSVVQVETTDESSTTSSTTNE